MRSARISGAFRDRLYLRGPFSADTAPGKRKAGDAPDCGKHEGLSLRGCNRPSCCRRRKPV